MANNLSVKISADVTEMQVKFAIAKAEVSGLTSEFTKLARASAQGLIDPAGQARMQELAGSIQQARSAAAGYAAELEKAGFSTSRFGSAVKEEVSGIGGAFEQLGAAATKAMQFTGMAVAIEAVTKLGDAIHEQAERANEILNMSEVLGVTTTQFQAMGVAAEEAGIGQEKLFQAAEKLVVVLDKARDGSSEAIDKMHSLGIANDQLKDKNFGSAEMLAFLSGRLRDAATHAETLKAISEILGARAVLAAGGIEQLSAKLEDWNKKAEEGHALLDDEARRLRDAGTWWTNLWRGIEKAKAELVLYTTEALRGVPGPFNMGKDAPPPAPVTADIQRGDPAQKAQAAAAKESQNAILQATIDSTKEQIEATKEGSDQRLALTRKLYQELLALYGDSGVDKVKEAHKALIEEERRHTQEIFSETERRLKTLIELDNKQVEAIRKSVEQSGVELDRELAMDQQAIAAREALGLLDIKGRQEHLAALVKLGQLSGAQELAAEIQLENEKYAIEAQGLKDRLALVQSDAGEREKILDKQAQLALSHANAIQAINDKVAEADATQWKKAVGEIENAEGTLVNDLLTKRKTLSQSLLQISANLVTQEIQNDLRALTTKKLLTDETKALDQGGYLYHAAIELKNLTSTQGSQAAQTAATLTQYQVRAGAETAAASQSGEIAAATGGKTVLADAAKAFSGTYASVAQIPYVGWILAPAAASAAYAAVAAYEGLASLDTGTMNVPRDMIAQLHQGEAVVPRPFAEGMRSAMNGGDGGSGGGDTHVHNHWSFIDTRGAEKFITTHGRHIAETVAGHVNAHLHSSRLWR